MSILFAQNNNLSNGSSLATFLPFLLIGLIFYFLIIKPQTKQKKEHNNMLNNLQKGDRVLTRGGIYGNIVNFQGENILILDISKNIHINVDRSYITTKLDSVNKKKK